MRRLLLLMIILLMSGFVTADYEIFENNQAKLTISPSIINSPVMLKEQSFTLDYKGDVNVSGIRAVYIFEEKLTKEKSNVFKYIPPSFDFVSHQKDFNLQTYDFNYVEIGGVNPYFITIFYTEDANNNTTHNIVWEHAVKEYENIGDGMKRFYWDVYEETTPETWSDLSGKWHYMGKYPSQYGDYWYYSDDFTLNVGDSYTWKLQYSVTKPSGKWTLAFVKGNAGCILSGTCDKQWLIDPWWNTDFTNLIPFTVKTSLFDLTNPVTTDFVLPIDINSDVTYFWENDDYGTGNGVTFVCTDCNLELDWQWEKFAPDENHAIARVEAIDTFPKNADINIMMYFNGDDVDYSDTGSAVYQSDYTAVYDYNETTGDTIDLTENDHNLTHYENPTLNSDGHINGAILYDETGTSEYSTTPTMLDGGASAFTIMFWTSRISDWNSGVADYDWIIEKYNNGDEQLIIRWDSGNGQILYIIESGNVDHRFLSAKNSWDANVWYHLTFTFNGTTNEMEMYVNGYTTDGGTLNEVMANFGAGTDQDWFFNVRPSDLGFGGTQKFDAFKYFEGKDLSADEVKLLYYAESGGGIYPLAGEEYNNPVSAPDIYNPVNESEVGGTVDYNCFVTDDSTIVFDVNLIYRDTNSVVLELETGGDGAGSFDSTVLNNTLYSFDCTVREVGTSAMYTADFNNNDYNFTIFNAPAVTTTSPDRYYAPYDDRVDLVDDNEFVNPDLFSNESAIARRLKGIEESAQQETFVVMLLVVLLAGTILWVAFKRRF